MAQHDIRKHIPLYAATDPSKFPPVEYRPYPYMPVKEGNVPYKTPAGKVVLIHNEDEEAEFRAAHPEALARKASAADVQDELQTLREENARLRFEQGGAAAGNKDKVMPASVASLVQGDESERGGEAAPADAPSEEPSAPERGTNRRPGRRLD